MVVIWSAFKNGIKIKLNAQLAVDIIANTNEQGFLYLSVLNFVRRIQFWCCVYIPENPRIKSL